MDAAGEFEGNVSTTSLLAVPVQGRVQLTGIMGLAVAASDGISLPTSILKLAPLRLRTQNSELRT